MNAPVPTLTSSTSADEPSAIFLLMIELAISGIDSTVPVTSRSAYSLRSAGARPSPAAHTTAPTSRSCAQELGVGQRGAPARNRLQLVERAAGVAEPAAGQLRHRGAAGRHQRRQRQRDLVADAARGVLVDRRSVDWTRGRDARPTRSSRRSTGPARRAPCRCSRIAMASAAICSSATTPRVYASITQSICSSGMRPPSRLMRITSTAHRTVSRHAQPSRPGRTPGAAGRSSAVAPRRCRRAGPGRRAPTAAAGSVRTASAPRRAESTHANATSRPPPDACNADTRPHSAHSPSP